MGDSILLSTTATPMTPSQPAQGVGFARFMELRGRRVVESFNVLWHSVGPGLYMSLPYHRRLDLDPRDAGPKIAAMGALGIRYPSLKWTGLPSGLYVCRRHGYDIPMLHRNCRSQVRHGLPVCEVRPLNEKEFSEDALRINISAMRRQNRYDPEFGERSQWLRFVKAAQQCPMISAIGSFVGGRLASYVITCVEDGWLQLLHRMTSLEFAAQHPSQVLDFTITRRALSDTSLVAASMGCAPLIPMQGLHEYKMRLGYDFEPQYSVIQFRPALQQFLASRVAAVGMHILRPLARSQRLRMALAVADGAALTRTQ